MKRAFYILIGFAFFLGVIIRLYFIKKEKDTLFSEHLSRYISQPERFSGLPEKIFYITLPSDTPLISKLDKNKSYLILYFRITDCGSCLEEMKNVFDSLRNLKNLNIFPVTDHPVLLEIKYFMYKLGFGEVVWDKNAYLLGSKIKSTPSYIFLKNNKIKDAGIIAPLKGEEGREIYGLYAHRLKLKFK